jgi:hypothetical protein
MHLKEKRIAEKFKGTGKEERRPAETHTGLLLRHCAAADIS